MTLWDLYQHSQIRTLRVSQRLADTDSLLRDRRHDRRADDLEERVEQLGEIVEGLWALCRERLGLTDEELIAAIQATIERHEADASTGPVPCTTCGAAITAEFDKCQFCGAASPRPTTPFSGL